MVQMSATPVHLKLMLMTSASNLRSLPTESSSRQMIFDLADERLFEWFSPGEPVEANAALIKQHFAAYEPMCRRINRETSTQHFHLCVRGGAADVDQPTGRMRLQIELP